MNSKKNILTVAPFLADCFVEADKIVFDVEQYQQFIQDNNLNIDHDKLVFPVQLDFRTNTKVTFSEVDDDGNLTEIEPIKLDEYLYEQVVSVDNNKTELVFIFWKKFKDDKPGQQFILLLTATDITITEQQDKAWQQIFGSDFDDYYQYFKQHFDSDRYVSDYHKCLELIDEYDTTKSSTNA